MARKKPKFQMLRFRKADAEHNLLAAVQHWAHARGGTVVIIGGVEVQDWAEGIGKYRVAVKCLGKAPTAKAKDGRLPGGKE